jgi:hypothetical protein
MKRGAARAQCNRIAIRICAPHQPVRVISAQRSGKIRELESLWPGRPKRFIFDGAELRGDMTFGSSGIRDGDSIIALPHESGDSVFTTNQWLSLSRDSNEFNECVRWMLDTATAGEAARLRDLHLAKMERKPRIFMKMCSPFISEESEASSLNVPHTRYQSPLAPSTEALPVFAFMNDNPCGPAIEPMDKKKIECSSP